jgi:hypothetical protein
MPSQYQTILIACPGNAMTAGPEAIHQLASDLIRLGHNAAVVYFPFSEEFQTPEPYKKYKLPIARYRDIEGELIIFPEIVTTYALKVQHAQAGIWWMSVNNYTCVRYGNAFRDKLRYLKNMIKGLRPLGGLRSLSHLKHFAQSYYALDFLRSNGISGQLLSDPIPVYTSQAYLDKLPLSLSTASRKNTILYNPHKGKKVLQSLMAHFPDWHFFPLVGFNREELAAQFLKSKLYIDFGHHPGKDRLPREAAIHGCCVITGLYGSAGNALDVNIPPAYKIDSRLPDFFSLFEIQVNLIFNHFEKCSLEFVDYRNTIAQEQIEFDRQIEHAFATQPGNKGH